MSWLRGPWLARLAVVCVLAGFAIDFAGARWGAYIATPIPRVYLADLLWIVGAALSLRPSVLRGLPRPMLVASVLSAAYVAVRGLVAVTDPAAQTTLILRDLAPFGYLAVVPLVAVALTAIEIRTWLWLLRIGPLLLFAGAMAYTLGAPFAVAGQLLGGEELGEMRFPGREDVLGTVLAIGVVAWSRFDRIEQVPAWARWPIQAVLVATAVLVGSQAGQVLVLLALIWVLVRARITLTAGRTIVAGVVLLAGLAAITVALVVGALTIPQKADVHVAVSTAPGDGDLGRERDRTEGRPWSRYEVPGIVEGLATIGARLSTTRDVLDATVQDGTALFGAGVGDPARLIETCGVTVAEYLDHVYNKCAVDSAQSAMPLRDPHNWAINLLLYQGIVGIVLFAGVLLVYWWRPPPDPTFSLSAVPAAMYAVAASVGVVFSSPFGLLPLATFTAYALSRRLRPDAAGRVGGTGNL